MPTQTLPPKAGAGLPQVRRRVFTATPQLCEHADQADQLLQAPCTVQLTTLIAGPEQLSPPCEAGGLSHLRVEHRHWSVVSLYVACEHIAQADHADHPPETEQQTYVF